MGQRLGTRADAREASFFLATTAKVKPTSLNEKTHFKASDARATASLGCLAASELGYLSQI